MSQTPEATVIRTQKQGALHDLVDGQLQIQRELPCQDEAFVASLERIESFLRENSCGDLRASLQGLDQAHLGSDHIAVLEKTLHLAGVLKEGEIFKGYKDHFTCGEGVRGAECFVSSGEVITDSTDRRFVVKHYIGTDGPRYKRERLMNNRASMVQEGFAAPELYSIGPAYSVEEYIPHQISEALAECKAREGDSPELAEAKTARLKRLAEGLAKMAARLDFFERFPGFEDQIRINDEDQPVVVDFGVDALPRDMKTNKRVIRDNLKNLYNFSSLVGDTKAMASAQTFGVHSEAKNAFKPELNIVNIYDQELKRLESEQQMEKQRSFMMIKPGFLQHRDRIVQMLQEKGFEVRHESKPCAMGAERAKQFYAEHDGKPFFPALTEYMATGNDPASGWNAGSPNVIALVVEGTPRDGKTVPQLVREVVGPTNAFKEDGTLKPEAEGTIRGTFARDGRCNAVHASDSIPSATREIGLWAKELGIKPPPEIETDPAQRPQQLDSPDKAASVAVG